MFVSIDKDNMQKNKNNVCHYFQVPNSSPNTIINFRLNQTFILEVHFLQGYYNQIQFVKYLIQIRSYIFSNKYRLFHSQFQKESNKIIFKI